MTEQTNTEVTESVTDLTEILEDAFDKDDYSPYQMANVVNSVLRGFEIKEIPPQMLYQYTKKGLIESFGGDEKGKGRKVTRETAIAWTETYIGKKLA